MALTSDQATLKLRKEQLAARIARGKGGPDDPIANNLRALIAEQEAAGTTLPLTGVEFAAEEKGKPLLAALEELRIAGEPAAKRQAFTPFARRGFGASGLARRGVREALGVREARFARERERIRADVLARQVQETLAQAEIQALREA
ncbi:hypothetical protein LCGC14_0800290 [marine sediment metagenome]|uniref:Uncharacterized protein n=1 Tax=marine sediment metagenome TaxID=412755 RepID=A0A0F9PPW1_9ZZZZ